jgi:hypothetical protein
MAFRVLEKVLGVALVDKLCAILLMKGDFNFFNKWFLRHEAVNKLYEIGHLPEDQYSKKAAQQRISNSTTGSRWTFQDSFVYLWSQYQRTHTNAMIGSTI